METLIEIMKWVSLLFIIIAFCITVHTALRMREAYLRGKMMRKRCGEEYYEAETIRYQIYNEWINKKANQELGASSWILIIATMAVVVLYIGKFFMDNWGNWDNNADYSKLGFTIKKCKSNNNWWKCILSILIILGTLAYILYTAPLLNPNKGAASYYTDGDLPIANRIAGVLTHLVLLLFLLPVILIWANSGTGNPGNPGKSFGPTFNEFVLDKTQYFILLLLLFGLLLFSFINVGFGVSITETIHKDYFDERVNNNTKTIDTNTLPTDILQKVINNAVTSSTVGDVTIAAESQQKATNTAYNTEKYRFYKMIYNGIKDVDKPDVVSEGDVKKGTYVNGTTQPVYPVMFKYILHSKTMDKLLRDSNVLAAPNSIASVVSNIDVTDKYKNMQGSDVSLGDAVNSFYITVMIIFGFVIGIIALIIYRDIVKSSPMYIVPIIVIIFLLLLGSLIYAYMSGVLLG